MARSCSAIATSSTAEAGYHHRPHYQPYHHVYVPVLRPHYVAPRPHYVTYGCYWKKQAVEGMATVFSGKAEAAEAAREGEIDQLHAKIGQLVVERDFLRRASGR